MDYLGWELRRQRAALAALLLGGEEDGPAEAVRDEARRSPAEFEPAGEDALKIAGRYAGAFGGAEGFYKESREAGEGLPAAPAGAGETPERRRRSGEGAGPEARGRRLEPADFRSGGTGASAEEAASGGGKRREEAVPGETAAGGMRFAGESPLETGTMEGGGTESALGPSAGTLFREVPATAGGIAASGPLGRRDSVPPKDLGLEGGYARPGGTALQTGGDGRKAAGIYEPPGFRSLWGGGGAAALQAEAGARELSRAVQRDARRYDGGFIIY